MQFPEDFSISLQFIKHSSLKFVVQLIELIKRKPEFLWQIHLHVF
jgi:hypothetical protein